MANLEVSIAGVKSPNPFWLASGPPTNTGDQVMRAFDMGWGGAVWKTLGTPIVNVFSRYGGLHKGSQRLVGLNNIELITDRPLEVNFKEIAEVKRRYPNNLVISSLMVETREEWREIIMRAEDAGVDLHELNFGCPHGMCERGMGSAVGQEPKVLERITEWAKEYATKPIIVKLTPNISDITVPGLAAVRAQADAVSLINTIKSLIGVDLDRMVPMPRVGSASTNGGYCGPAVKPIALHMVASLARHPQFTLPISGIGGIGSWRDAAEFMTLGATTVQVCTAAMHYGYKIVEDMSAGLNDFLDSRGMASAMDLVGLAVGGFKNWGELDLNYKAVAKIDATKCIGCQLCYVACWDGAHQCIDLPGAQQTSKSEHALRIPTVRESDCIGCNLCSLVCPVPDCISMVEPAREKDPVHWQEFVDSGQDRSLLAARPDESSFKASNPKRGVKAH